LPSEEKGLEGRAEAANLVGIFAALSGREKTGVLAEYGGANFSTFKNALVDLAVEKLSPITAEMRKITANHDYIDTVLRDGAERARALANENMKAVKDIVGFCGRRGPYPAARDQPRRGPSSAAVDTLASSTIGARRPASSCKLHAPLVEGVDVPDHRLREHLVLIERDEAAERARIEFSIEQRARRAVAGKSLMRRQAFDFGSKRPSLRSSALASSACAPA